MSVIGSLAVPRPGPARASLSRLVSWIDPAHASLSQAEKKHSEVSFPSSLAGAVQEGVPT
jgi:hypothetical protein